MPHLRKVLAIIYSANKRSYRNAALGSRYNFVGAGAGHLFPVAQKFETKFGPPQRHRAAARPEENGRAQIVIPRAAAKGQKGAQQVF